RWNDVEGRQLLDSAWMIEREPIRDAPTTIVGGQPEAHMAESLHCLDHDLRHRTLVVWRMGFRRLAAHPTSRSRANPQSRGRSVWRAPERRDATSRLSAYNHAATRAADHCRRFAQRFFRRWCRSSAKQNPETGQSGRA